MKTHISLAEARVTMNKQIGKHFDKLSDEAKLDEVVDEINKEFYVNGANTDLAFGYILTAKEDGDRGSTLSIIHNKSKVEAAESSALTIDQLENLFTKAKELTTILKDSKQHIKETEYIMKKVTQFADRMSKARDVTPIGKRRAGVAKNIQTAFAVFNAKLPNIDAKLVASTLAFIDLNLTAYM